MPKPSGLGCYDLFRAGIIYSIPYCKVCIERVEKLKYVCYGPYLDEQKDNLDIERGKENDFENRSYQACLNQTRNQIKYELV